MSDVKRLLMSDFSGRLFWRTTSVSSQTDIYGDTLFYPELIQVLHKQNRKYCDFRSLSKFLIYAGNNWTWQWTRLKLLKHRWKIVKALLQQFWIRCQLSLWFVLMWKWFIFTKSFVFGPADPFSWQSWHGCNGSYVMLWSNSNCQS